MERRQTKRWRNGIIASAAAHVARETGSAEDEDLVNEAAVQMFCMRATCSSRRTEKCRTEARWRRSSGVDLQCR